MRPVINLRPLNNFLRHEHFKMEGIHVVKDLLRQGDWLTRIDLKDAYFAIPIHTQDRKYLILVAEQVIPIHLPAFLSPESVHEGTETSNSLPQEQGGAVCDLHRRHTVYAPRQGQAIRDHGYSSYTVGSSWVSCELHKVSTNTDPEARFPGICDRHTEEGALPSSRETAQADERCQSHSESPVSLSTAPGQAMSATIQAVHPAPLNYRSIQCLKHAALRRGGYDRGRSQ